MKSRNSKAVKVGGFDHVDYLVIGGWPLPKKRNPVVIQTMWKDSLSLSDLEKNRDETIVRIKRLQDLGCGLLRFAVPDMDAAEALGQLASLVSMPLVADIHFDYKIALRCLDYPIAKIRINPGNIGSPEKQRAVIEKAAAKARPMRIGVNAGSLPLDLREEVQSGRLDRTEALVRSAERELKIFDEYGFTNALVSMKASGIADTIKANRILAERTDAPLHIGLTEAGPLVAGVVRNTGALLALLAEGIGDTIRVSLSDTMENEVIAAREILLAASDIAGEKPKGVRVISCPRCGRHGFDTHGFTVRLLDRLYGMDKNITVAIMGCAVNGPGEARDADLGITGAGDKVLIFRNGKVIRTVDAPDAEKAFEEELKLL